METVLYENFNIQNTWKRKKRKMWKKTKFWASFMIKGRRFLAHNKVDNHLKKFFWCYGSAITYLVTFFMRSKFRIELRFQKKNTEMRCTCFALNVTCDIFEIWSSSWDSCIYRFRVQSGAHRMPTIEKHLKYRYDLHLRT